MWITLYASASQLCIFKFCKTCNVHLMWNTQIKIQHNQVQHWGLKQSYGVKFQRTNILMGTLLLQQLEHFV